jgi:hypothetical protein
MRSSSGGFGSFFATFAPIAEELLTAKTAMKFREEREEGLSLRLCALCGEISSCI